MGGMRQPSQERLCIPSVNVQRENSQEYEWHGGLWRCLGFGSKVEDFGWLLRTCKEVVFRLCCIHFLLVTCVIAGEKITRTKKRVSLGGTHTRDKWRRSSRDLGCAQHGDTCVHILVNILKANTGRLRYEHPFREKQAHGLSIPGILERPHSDRLQVNIAVENPRIKGFQDHERWLRGASKSRVVRAAQCSRYGTYLQAIYRLHHTPHVRRQRPHHGNAVAERHHGKPMLRRRTKATGASEWSPRDETVAQHNGGTSCTNSSENNRS